MTSVNVDDAVIVRLNQIVKLLALEVTRGLTRSEQVLLLRNAGFQVKEIADALGVKSNAVSVILYSAKSKPRRRDTGEGSSKR